MKRQILALAALLAVPAVALADVCTDIGSQYLQLIAQEEQLANDAIAFSSSSEEQQAIWNTYLIRRSLLESEMSSTLSALGCVDSTSGGGDNTGDTGDSGTGGGDDGAVVSDPGGDTGGDDMSGTDDDVASLTCDALKAEIKAEAQRLASEGRGFSESARYVRSRKSEISEVCGNFGRGRSHVGGNVPSALPSGSPVVSNPVRSHPVFDNVEDSHPRNRGRGKKKGHR